MKVICKICKKLVPKRKLAHLEVRVMYCFDDIILQTCKNCYTGTTFLLTGFSEKLRDENTKKIKRITKKYGVLACKAGYDGP